MGEGEGARTRPYWDATYTDHKSFLIHRRGHAVAIAVSVSRIHASTGPGVQ